MRGWTPSARWAATYTPDCAALHPARLVRGLARAVERRGGGIHERTRCERSPHRPVRAAGARCAPTWWCGPPRATPAARAACGATGAGLLPDRRHRAAARRRVGAHRAPGAGDLHRPPPPGGLRPAHRRRSAGLRRPRGAVPLRLVGAPEHDREDAVFAMLRETLRRDVPGAARARFTHAWGGALGIPRDWIASVGLDPTTGLGWAGGYVGDGVATTNLAGRTLRDLILGRDDRPHPAALGQPPLASLGAGAAAMARRQHRPARDDDRRRRGANHRSSEPSGPRDGTVGGRPLSRPGAVGALSLAAEHPQRPPERRSPRRDVSAYDTSEAGP